jgi:colanic acid biosynthesis glycosyl transferase WcaI
MQRAVQLWSYNYEPEPTGIAPVSAALARGLSDLGWRVDVVAAHPHYPEPKWGTRLVPYVERRGGIRVVRLPLWVGRGTPSQRIRQELSYASLLSAAAPLTGPPLIPRPVAKIVASPSFPALLPAMVNARARRLPWILWLHDLLPDGAAATGQIAEGGAVMRASRWLERTAYRNADEIVTLSAPFVANLLAKGVPKRKLSLIYDPTTRGFPDTAAGDEARRSKSLLCMGNIGHSQGLAPIVRAFEASDAAATFVITGTGVAAPAVAAERRSDRVQLRGVVPDDELDQLLRTSAIGVVTQSYEGSEFNLPSKLMVYMAYGLPILAAVNPAGEVARLVEESKAGWVVDSSRPEDFPQIVSRLSGDPGELAARGAAARAYATENFSPRGFAKQFDRLLTSVVARKDPGRTARIDAESSGRV